MSKRNIPAVGNADFDWDMYEGGWNGLSLSPNKKIKNKHNLVVYCHEPYAEDVLNKYFNSVEPVSKELKKNVTVDITDLTPMSHDRVMASINGGANNIIIDLNKEQRFLNTLQSNNEAVTKDRFLEMLKDPEIRQTILNMGLAAKVGTDVEKASIWDGYVERLSTEMREQIRLRKKAYMAKIISSNNGGYVVEVANTLKAFMPGSMAAANKLMNYEELVGREMEVMVESYDEKHGFVVSRKKYLQTIAPYYINQILTTVKDAPDTLYAGTITGATNFGIFVELNDNECVTGMLHKTVISDDLREQLRQGKIHQGMPIQVYVHGIENKKLVFSDVCSADRPAVIARREAEDDQERAAHVQEKAAKAREAAAAQKGEAEE